MVMVMVMVMFAWIDNDEVSEVTSESCIWHMRPCTQRRVYVLETPSMGVARAGKAGVGEMCTSKRVYVRLPGLCRGRT